MSPEVTNFHHQRMSHGIYDCEKSDIWSIGCIHFQLRTCLPLLDSSVLKATYEDFTAATGLLSRNDSHFFYDEATSFSTMTQHHVIVLFNNSKFACKYGILEKVYEVAQWDRTWWKIRKVWLD